MILFFIVITGISLRLYQLGAFSLWFDEADSILSAIPPFQVLGMLKAGRVLVMHNLFLNFWKIAGTDEFTLRISSAIFGVLAIVVLYRIAEYVFDKKTALWSAFLLSISPFNIYYSQELRPYAMMVLLTLCAVYCLVKGLKEKKITYWLGYVVFTVLNFYTHWIASFYFFTVIVYFIIWRRDHKEVQKAFIFSNAVVVLLSIPWVWSLVRVFRLILDWDSLFSKISIGWIPAVDYASIPFTLKNFAAGYSVNYFIGGAALLLYGIFFLRGVFLLRNDRKMWLMFLLFVFPIILLYGISEYRSCYVDRYLIVSSAFFYLIVACGLRDTKRVLRIAVLGAFIVFSACGLIMQYHNFLAGDFIEHRGAQCKKQEHRAADYVLQRLNPEDGILHVCRSTVLPFEFYFKYGEKTGCGLRGNDHPQTLVFLRGREDSLPTLELYKYSLVTGDLDSHYVYRPLNAPVRSYNRIWLIFSEWDFSSASLPGSPGNKVIDLLKENYRIVDFKRFYGVEVYLFIKK
ncbi:MAG: glycosyltransferase family 39 protein [Candidatus Omnitrophica bacterium]|jgi:hypothetical protein|nr:glycosyltransferase family 39 protein [Candidatus Omnitrophota bacterium]MDD3274488.1 glycosyltransferase family 39 protein [Candidatus Omnitrophota bacterium]MDD5078179.1 glycosyltransferase family 39 protein [Candidatus Omnitrophota bacterium]MDD5724780.1 glycosyltransferase family 39 protein [Candidatus Omnitrophota bacterium]